MNQQELFVKMAIQQWSGIVNRTEKFINGVSEDELLQPVSPGRNTGFYILLHLTKASDKMNEILMLGDRLYPDLFEETTISPADLKTA